MKTLKIHPYPSLSRAEKKLLADIKAILAAKSRPVEFQPKVKFSPLIQHIKP